MTLTEDIIELMNNHNIGVSQLNNFVSQMKREEENLKERATENESFVGKCFFEDDKFYKVISPKSFTEWHVECLVFSTHPTDTKFIVINDRLGEYKFLSFRTEGVMVNNLKKMKEISESEYNSHARQYLEEMLSLKWKW